MLRLLLDANISPTVAREVRRHFPECPVVAICDWLDGAYVRERDDGKILAEAHRRSLTLMTRDLSTIPTLLSSWFADGRSHSGVVFIDERTIPEGNVGALVHAIRRLFHEESDADWTDRVIFIR